MTRFVTINEIMEQSGVKFGTSGARGLAARMTDRVCYAYTSAFLQYLEKNREINETDVIGIGGDLRPSTERIMLSAAQAVMDRGYGICNSGRLPSPALALYGLENKVPTIMVTGSHIPEDRNGIKFTKSTGEILKKDEAGIRLEAVELPEWKFDRNENLIKGNAYGSHDSTAIRNYVDRYIDFFRPGVLKGATVGIYQHSAVGRDILVSIFKALGAETISLGRSDHFVPVDTEAIRDEEIEKAARWAAEFKIDAIVSTDGDSDRPLISDEKGNILRGDVAGVICAKFLGADTVVTPVTSNSVAEKCGFFKNIIRSRVGSPYVIEAMQLAAANGAQRVCGYEANGGFLIGADISHEDRKLRSLPTRDAVIVLLSIMLTARDSGKPISELMRMLPKRFTYSDRIKNFPTEISHSKLREFKVENSDEQVAKLEAVFKNRFGAVSKVNNLDGCRIHFKNGDVLHLRPSGNAPEFRCYTESNCPDKAREAALDAMKIMRSWL